MNQPPLYHEAATPGSTAPGAGMRNAAGSGAAAFGAFIHLPITSQPFNVAYKHPPSFSRVSGTPRMSFQTAPPPATGGPARPGFPTVSPGAILNGVNAGAVGDRASNISDTIFRAKGKIADAIPAGISQRVIAFAHRGSRVNVNPGNVPASGTK